MAGAYVHGIIPSSMMSFKMASAGPLAGALKQDGRSGVLGVIGASSDPVALNVQVNERRFDYFVVRHRFLTVPFIALTTLSSVLAESPAMGEKTLTLDWAVTLRNHGTVRFKEMLLTGQPGGAVADRIAEPMNRMFANPFGPAIVDTVTVRVAVQDALRLRRITRINTDRSQVEPGHPLQVRIEFEQYDGRAIEESLTLEVPWDLAGNEVFVEVLDSRSYWEAEQHRHTAPPILTQPYAFVQI